MDERIQAIRGMKDILPQEMPLLHAVEAILRSCVVAYGYEEIRTPLVEQAALFKRSIGEMTDIVEKEMYTFTDLNGELISLRPEGTASIVRAGLEHGLLYHQQQRFWYMGSMFRHERPQKGRYRQFTHFGVEAYGMSGVAIELELLAMNYRMWQSLHVAEHVQLEINTIGTLEERGAYKKTLVDYFMAHASTLDEDSQRRLHRNPLRILDSKNPAMQALIQDAPKLLDTLTGDSQTRFQALCEGLTALNIPYTVNPRLVRGLDYYSQTVYEWVSTKLGSQATVCGGGRYDALVSYLGGQPNDAVGFSLGVERLLLLMEAVDALQVIPTPPDVFMISEGLAANIKALRLAEVLRTAGFSVLVHAGVASFKSQFKKASTSGAPVAVMITEEDVNNAEVRIKWLHRDRAQETCSDEQLIEILRK